MNRKTMMCLMLALTAGLAGLAYAAEPAAGQKALLQKVELLRLAEELGLDESAGLRLLTEFNEHHARMQGLCAKRAALAGQLDAGSDARAVLDGLMDLDDQILDLQLDTFERMSRELNTYQQARLYLFLMPGSDGVESTPRPATAAPVPAVSAAPAAADEPAAVEPAGDEAEIAALVQELKMALEALDIDAVMKVFSEQFAHPEVGGKEEARYLLEMGMDMGYADDGEVYTDYMKIQLDGDTATVYPIELSAPAGAVTLELVLGKDNGKWLIRGLNVDGL